MSPAFGYLCRFLLPSSLVCRRCAAGGLRGWTAVGGSRGRAPVLLRFLGVFALPRFPRRRRPARPVRPLPLPASPLRSGARLVRCRPDLATPGTPCASRRLRRHSAPHSLTRPRGFTPGRAKLWERRPSLAASLD